MTNETILVVDADTKSQKVLEISLKKVGYRVVITESVSQAREVVQDGQPDLIICDTQFPGSSEDGFTFCKNLKGHPGHRQIPFIFLTEQDSLAEKMYGLEVGADEYLTKPVYIKEVTSQVEILLQKRAHARLRVGEVEEFEADLEDVTLIDLLQTIEQERRSGAVEIISGARTGAVYFSEGNILDARCSKLRGEDALYRLMLWPDGKMKVRYQPMDGRVDHVEKDSGALLIEGIRRLEQWYELSAKLPPLGRVYEADYQRLPELLPTLPDEVGRLVRLFDGVRSLGNIVEDSPFNDIISLQIMQRLLDDGVLREVTTGAHDEGDARRRTNLEAWLAGSDQQDVRKAFAAADVSADLVEEDEVRGPGHWRVRWDEPTDELPREDSATSPQALERSISELREREERRREEEARHLIRQSGRFEAVAPGDQRPQDDAPASSGRRTTRPLDSMERETQPGPSPRQRQMTPIAAPHVGMDAPHEPPAADQTSPGMQVALLRGSHERSLDQMEGSEAELGDDVTDEFYGSMSSFGRDQEEESEQTAASVEDDFFGETPKTGQGAIEAGAASSETVLDDDSDSDQGVDSTLDRRAAAVQEAAELTREATQNLRESAADPSISRYQYDEVDEEESAGLEAEAEKTEESTLHQGDSDPDPDGWTTLHGEQAGRRNRRITEKLPDIDEVFESEASEPEAFEFREEAESGDKPPVKEPDEIETAELPRAPQDASEPSLTEESEASQALFVEDEARNESEDKSADGSVGESEKIAEEETVEEEVSAQDDERVQDDERGDAPQVGSESAEEPEEKTGEKIGEKTGEKTGEAEQEDAAAEKPADGRPLTVPPGAISAIDTTDPDGISRTAVDRRMVKIEYDLRDPASIDEADARKLGEKNPTRVEIDMPEGKRAAKYAGFTLDGQGVDAAAADSDESADSAESTAESDSTDGSGNESASDEDKSSSAEELNEKPGNQDTNTNENADKKISDEDKNEVEDKEQVKSDDDGDLTSAPLSEAAASEVLASAVAPAGVVDGDEEETLDLERDASAAAMAAELHESKTTKKEQATSEKEQAAASVSEQTTGGQTQEDAFFADGDQGEYDWQFEDVPKSKNRWKYFSAIAILAGATALLITWYVVGGQDESIPDESVVADADDQIDEAENTGVPGTVQAPADESQNEAESGLANSRDPLEAADQGADLVRESAQAAAVMLAEMDPDAVDERVEGAQGDADTDGVADKENVDGEENAAGEIAEQQTEDEPASSASAQENAPDNAQDSADAPASFAGRLSAAEAQVKAGQNAAALRELRKLTEEQSNDSKAAYLHGLAALGAGNYSESAKQLGRADQLGYGDAEMYLDLATAHQLNGDNGQAKSAYQKFLTRQPNGKRADEVRSILERL